MNLLGKIQSRIISYPLKEEVLDKLAPQNHHLKLLKLQAKNLSRIQILNQKSELTKLLLKMRKNCNNRKKKQIQDNSVLNVKTMLVTLNKPWPK